MLLFHTESSTKYGKPGLYWVNHFTTICEEHFFQECSLFFFEKQEGVSLSQAGIPAYVLTIKFNGFTGGSAYIFDTSQTPFYNPERYFSMGSGYENVSIQWSIPPGLRGNNYTGNGSPMLQPGNSVTVRVAKSTSGGWDYMKTFTLLAQDQTISVP